MKEIYTPTKARENFYSILKEVNNQKKPVSISSNKGDSDAVIIGRDDWNSIQETLFLANAGVINQINERKDDKELDFNKVWSEI